MRRESENNIVMHINNYIFCLTLYICRIEVSMFIEVITSTEKKEKSLSKL
jgi:hypothetical protein